MDISGLSSEDLRKAKGGEEAGTAGRRTPAVPYCTKARSVCCKYRTEVVEPELGCLEITLWGSQSYTVWAGAEHLETEPRQVFVDRVVLSLIRKRGQGKGLKMDRKVRSVAPRDFRVTG